MSEDQNTVVLSGNVGHVDDVQYSGDMPRLRIRFASNRRAKGRDGAWGEETMWCTTTVFGGRAEPLGRLLQKGDKICVSGELVVRTYDKKDGTTGVDVCVERSSVVLMGGKREGGERRDNARSSGGNPGGGYSDFPADDFGDSDVDLDGTIPF